MTAFPAPRFTIEQYLEFEKDSEIRYEYVDGYLVAMPGESPRANKIVGRLRRLLEDQFEERGYDVFTNDVKLKVSNTRIRYPDVMMVPELGDDTVPFLGRAVLTGEVVSKSSRSTDYSDKLNEYGAMPDVRYYLIVEQDRPRVSLYEFDGRGNNRYQLLEGLNATVRLPLLDGEFTLRALYGRVKFTEPSGGLN